MHPVLFEYGTFKLQSFAFFYNIVVATCAIVYTLEIERQGIPPARMPFFLRWLPDSLQKNIWFAGAWISGSYMAVGLGGAHLFYAVSNTVMQGWGMSLSIEGWAYLFAMSFNNSMWFGGFLLCMVWTAYVARLHPIPYLKLLDIGMLAAVIGQVPGRIACFLAGCCYGKPTTMPWGIVYDSDDALLHFPRGTHLHPSHFYEATLMLILFIYMWRKRTSNTFDGQTSIRYMIWGGLARFVTEFYRADTPRGVIWPWLSISQIIGLGLCALGIVLHLVLSRKAAIGKAAIGATA